MAAEHLQFVADDVLLAQNWHLKATGSRSDQEAAHRQT